MITFPFLKPNLVRHSEYLKYLKRIDESRIYSNNGPLNVEFERRVKNEIFANEGGVVTTSNATVGLMLAISQIKRPKGRYALMPSFTFAATPLAAIWCGLEPYFIDIRPGDWCLDEKLLEETIERLGDEIAVVMPYPVFGTSIELSFYERLHRSGVPVVIDAAPCFGTVSTEGKQFGQSFPGAVVFSFHATKAFGIGEGGLLYSGDTELVERCRQASNFGFGSQREATILGLNGKLSEFSAAIALAPLDVFKEKTQHRQTVNRWYQEEFNHHDLFSAGWRFQESCGSIPFQFQPVLCPDSCSNMDVVSRLELNGVQGRTYFYPACHQQEQFRIYLHSRMDVTERVSLRSVSLPLWEEMSQADVKMIVECL